MKKLAKVTPDDFYEEGTPITKSLSSFKNELRPGDIILTKQPNAPLYKKLARGLMGRGSWSHTGVYIGDGKVLHWYGPLRKSQGRRGSSYIRQHSLKALAAGKKGRDFMAVRPKNITDEERKKARENLSVLKKQIKKYNIADFVRAALSPKGEEYLREEINSAICTAIPALAYKNRSFANKSPLHLKPVDFLSSPETNEVAAYSTPHATP